MKQKYTLVKDAKEHILFLTNPDEYFRLMAVKK